MRNGCFCRPACYPEGMADIFNLEQRDLKTVQRFYSQAPKKFRAVTGRVLNAFAFDTRKQAIKFVETEMMSRRKGFANRVLKVQTANFFSPIQSQASRVGSIKFPRFSGWIEQETGEQPQRRVATLLGRGGSKKRQISGPHRLRRGRKFKTPDEYKGRTSTQRAVVMMQHLSRTGYKKPFIIRGHRRMAPGLYKFRGRGKARGPSMLISFNPVQKRVRKNRWLTRSTQRMYKALNLRAVYKRAIWQTFKVRVS